MMNVKKSGWAGKAKVALVLSAVAVFSLVMMQCNSKLDEQVLLDSQPSSALEVSDGIDVPVLPESPYKININPSISTVDLTISGNKITINGEAVEVDQIASVVKNASNERTVVITQIDRAQPMSLVREVQWEFRKADLLRFLYVGQTPTGRQVEVPIRLPYVPGNELPSINEKYARENNIGLLKIQMSDNTGPANQQKVYDFVKGQVAEQKSNYVVSARYSDDDTYNEYLVDLFYIQAGFYQMYDERAQELYGKSFREIFENGSTNEEYAEMYDAIKKGIPMALSIAE